MGIIKAIAYIIVAIEGTVGWYFTYHSFSIGNTYNGYLGLFLAIMFDLILLTIILKNIKNAENYIGIRAWVLIILGIYIVAGTIFFSKYDITALYGPPLAGIAVILHGASIIIKANNQERSKSLKELEYDKITKENQYHNHLNNYNNLKNERDEFIKREKEKERMKKMGEEYNTIK